MCVVAIVDTNVLPLLAGGRRNNDSLLLQWIGRRHGILAFPRRRQLLEGTYEKSKSDGITWKI